MQWRSEKEVTHFEVQLSLGTHGSGHLDQDVYAAVVTKKAGAWQQANYFYFSTGALLRASPSSS
jgi:hypothetical protein